VILPSIFLRNEPACGQDVDDQEFYNGGFGPEKNPQKNPHKIIGGGGLNPENHPLYTPLG